MSVRTLALLLALSITPQSAVPQSTFGSIVGVVKDPGELVVGGAQVRLSNVDDKSTRTAMPTSRYKSCCTVAFIPTAAGARSARNRTR